MERMDNAPYDFVVNFEDSDSKAFEDLYIGLSA